MKKSCKKPVSRGRKLDKQLNFSHLSIDCQYDSVVLISKVSYGERILTSFNNQFLFYSSGSFPCNDTMQEVSDSDNSSSIDETEIVCMARESKLARPGLEGLALKKIVTRNRPMFEELFAEKPDSKCNVGQGQAQAFADNAECGTRCLGDVREPSRFKAAIDTILEWIFCGMIAAK